MLPHNATPEVSQMARGRLTMDRLQELVRLHRLEVGARERARLLGMSPNTERRYRDAVQKAGLLEGSPNELPELDVLKSAVRLSMPSRIPEQQVSKLEEWRTQIQALMDAGLRAKEIRRRLKESTDFDGTYSQVKRFVRALRRAKGVSAKDVAIPVQTPPGDVVQIDFGYVGKLMDPATRTLRKTWVFVAVLGCSRFMWAKLVFDQKVETWLQLHVDLIEALGGVPHTFVPDNLKAAVIKAAFTASDTTALNRSYRELARHYGFMVDPTPPYSPQKKGKVESGVKYLKNSVLQARDGQDVMEVQRLLDLFLDSDANVRMHGTTQRIPAEELALETPLFHPLPSVRYEPIVWRQAKVLADTHVQFDKRLYSVPWRLVGQQVWVRATQQSVWIYADDERVATHSREDDGHRSTIDAHLPEGRRDLRHRSRKHWETRGDALGEEVGALVRALFDSDDVHYQIRTVQAVVRYLEDFPLERAQAAAKRALFYGVDTYSGIKKILVDALDQQPLPTAVLPVANGTLTEPRFARDVSELVALSGKEFGHEPH